MYHYQYLHHTALTDHWEAADPWQQDLLPTSSNPSKAYSRETTGLSRDAGIMQNITPYGGLVRAQTVAPSPKPVLFYCSHLNGTTGLRMSMSHANVAM